MVSREIPLERKIGMVSYQVQSFALNELVPNSGEHTGKEVTTRGSCPQLGQWRVGLFLGQCHRQRALPLSILLKGQR